MSCHQCEAPTQKYTFRGGYIEDESGDRWWSADFVALIERERDEARARVEGLGAGMTALSMLLGHPPEGLIAAVKDLLKRVDSLKAELELAHSMHNVAVKERDFYKTRLAHAEADAEQAVAVLQGERDEALLCARVEADNFDEARDALREIAEAPCVWSDPAPFCKCPTCQARGALKTLGKGKPKK